jgi:hypothetical protein
VAKLLEKNVSRRLSAAQVTLYNTDN